MPDLIRTIRLPLPLGMGKVNSYLIQTSAGFVLIDSGGSNARKHLGAALQEAGCQPGTLKLIVITHGDYDHTGNAADLRQRFGAEIAMHPGDLGMAVDGDMFYNRRSRGVLLRKLIPLLSGFGKKERFTPDVPLEDGQSLDAWGYDARVVSIPGHSKGSIGILSAAGDLFCGDLLVNQGTPEINSIMDDLPTARRSLELLRSLRIAMIYPGHGEPFTLEQIPA